jgi:arylsulfatase
MFEGGAMMPDRPLYWEHEGNRAIRRGRWKLVAPYQGEWELYDLQVDRTETSDLAAQRPAIAAELSGLWESWAARVGVVPWQDVRPR